MSFKGVLKKKFKIKNPINSIKKKRQKNKHIISEQSVEKYLKFDTGSIKNEYPITDKEKYKITDNDVKSGKEENCQEINIENIKLESTKKKKKHGSTNNDIIDETKEPIKKRVTFAADVKSEKDDKCTAGKMILLSLNKRKKKNYIKKLKAKKNKQKNAKKCEENAAAASTPRQKLAIEYLLQWKNDRLNWKFKKIYQLWLIKNTYDSVKISKEHFDILVEYLEAIEGKSRSLILQNANTVVAESSASNEQQQELNSSQTNKYQRARTIIQMFG